MKSSGQLQSYYVNFITIHFQWQPGSFYKLFCQPLLSHILRDDKGFNTKLLAHYQVWGSDSWEGGSLTHQRLLKTLYNINPKAIGSLTSVV